MRWIGLLIVIVGLIALVLVTTQRLGPTAVSLRSPTPTFTLISSSTSTATPTPFPTPTFIPTSSPIILAGREVRAAPAATTCRFSGLARLHLGPAPPGTRVEARVDGEKVAETVVTGQGDKAVYTFILDRQYAGKRVVFRYPTYPHVSQAGQAICELGTEQVLVLEGAALRGCGGG